MDTVLTIILWLGSGFAFAGGMFAGMMLMALATGSRSRAEKQTDRTIELMEERNDLDRRKILAMESIAESTAQRRST